MFTTEGKKNLILFKINVTALAKTIGKGRPWTSQVLHGHKTSPATRKLIADALKMKIEDLWPHDSDRRVA